jgi:hypothetical protein
MFRQCCNATDQKRLLLQSSRHPPLELRRFMAGPWTASILSAEEIDELLVELQQTEACPLDWVAEGGAEMGQD